MNGIERWLTHRRRGLEQVPSLDAALLTGGALRYAWYRLRYVLLRALLRTGFRLAEVALFSSVFSFGLLGHLLVFRSVALLAAGVWWGSLETLRTDVRELGRHGRWPQASRCVGQWLAAAVLLALGVLGGCLAWIQWGPSPFKSFSVLDVYVLGCGIRLAADLVTRTYHSGIYALRRVYRPLWSLLAVDLADVVVLGVLWIWLGPWALGISLAIVGLLRAGLALRFTRRTYRGSQLQPGPFLGWFRALRRAKWTPRRTLVYGLGNSVAQLDAVIVMALLAGGDGGGVILLASLLHVVAPLQASSISWSRLFYFDFKRLELWSSPLLLARFEAFLRRVALIVPLPIGVVTLGLMAAFWRGPYLNMALLLTLLAGARAWVSLRHLRAFSLSDNGYLLRLAVGLGTIAAVVLLMKKEPELVLAALSAMLVALLLVLRSCHHWRPHSELPAPPISLSTWAAALSAESTPVRIGLARADRSLLSAEKLAQSLASTIRSHRIARLGRDVLVWFEPAPGTRRGALLQASGGSIRALSLAPPAPNGQAALRAGVADPAWDRIVEPSLAELSKFESGAPGTVGPPNTSPANGHQSRLDTSALAISNLRSTLNGLDPGARILPLESAGSLPQLDGWPPRKLRSLVLASLHRDSHFRRFGSVAVAVLAPRGNPLALVILPITPTPINVTPACPDTPPKPSGASAPCATTPAPSLRSLATAALRKAEIVLALS